nr:MAG TPA: minor structural protein [Caudoviricetes sp.]
MKDVYEILKQVGIEVPEDKKDEFKKAFFENYKTISEFDSMKQKWETATSATSDLQKKYDTDISTRDTDLADLKKQLEDAGVDKDKLNDLTTKLTNLQTDYDTAKTKYQQDLAKQKYEFAIKELTNSIKFTSASAKKAFLTDAIAKNLSMEGDSVLGFQDFVTAYKEQDASAFVSEDEDKPKPPIFSGKTSVLDTDDPKEKPKTRPIII